MDKIKKIKSIIASEQNIISYNRCNYTIQLKYLAYQAISNLLDVYQDSMVNYLIANTRAGGFQHKIFQEYIKLIEEVLPFSIIKNKETYKISSVLDKHLNLFLGFSSFNARVNSKLEIPNNTEEFYIGGRKAAISQPCYIGKILSIYQLNSDLSLLDKVEEYTFLKIKMFDIEPNTEVRVTHLRVYPHYQMGGMVYINRARKTLVDKVKNVKTKYITI